MPAPNALQLPPPANWQDFEALCRDLWARLWEDTNAQKNGRNGQEQAGVDVFSSKQPQRGVQCKQKDAITGATLTRAQVLAEVEKAKNFKPVLTELVLATTGPRQARIQELVRDLNQQGWAPFTVLVWSWEDIASELLKHDDLLELYYPWLGFDRGTRGLLNTYLEHLWNRLSLIRLTAIRTGANDVLSLAEVYTALDVERMCEPVQDAPARRLSALEFVSAEPRAVLLGGSGSGKSCFLSWLALCLAGERLGKGIDLHHLHGFRGGHNGGPPPIWTHGALLPLFVELLQFVRDHDHFPGPDTQADAQHLIGHITGKKARCTLPRELMPYVQDLLGPRHRGRGALLLLDGLDGTPEDTRHQIKRTIQAFVNAYPNCRVLVTSRPYAYRHNDAWNLDGFVVERLAAFDDGKISAFVTDWYKAAGRQGLAAAEAEARAEDLIDAIHTVESLRHLARRPLMLTMMADLHQSGVAVRGGRARLYAETTKLLFDRWNPPMRDARVTATKVFGIPRKNLRDALRAIGLRAHLEAQRVDSSEPADIPFSMVWEELGKVRPRGTERVDERQVLEYLDHHCGILQRMGGNVYRFPHRSIQEYLAAIELSRDPNFPHQLAELVRTDLGLWREVLEFALLHATARPLHAWSIIDELVDDNTTQENAVVTGRIVTVLAAALGETPLGSTVSKLASRILKRLRDWLCTILDDGERFTAPDRIAAGNALGRIGDPRIGHRADNFLAIREASEQRLGRFPVTVQEYAEFVDSGGDKPPDWTRQLRYRNRPVVHVSWHDASNYCKWRSAQAQEQVRLPSAAEHDSAASPDGRPWPWDSNLGGPSPELANYNRNVGHPTPVGCYPRGQGKHGHLDLAGNVWEWLEDERKGMRYSAGGGWLNSEALLRYGERIDLDPNRRDVIIGFRVVVSPLPLAQVSSGGAAETGETLSSINVT